MKLLIIPFLICTLLRIGQAQTKSNYDIAMEYSQQENYEKAVEYLLIAINNKEVSQSNYFWVGRFYYQLNDYKNAIVYLKKGLKFNNNTGSISYYELFIECYFKLGNIKEAEKYFNLAKNLEYDYDSKFLRFEKVGFRFLATSGVDDIYYEVKTLNNKNRIIKVWLKRYWDSYSILPEDLNNIVKSCWENGTYNQQKSKILINKKVNEISKEKRGEDYIISLEEFDCKERKSRIIEFTSYSKKGEPIDQSNFYKLNADSYDNGWNNVIPNSVGETILENLCKLK